MPENFYRVYDRSKKPMNNESDGDDDQGDRYVSHDNPNEDLALSPEDELIKGGESKSSETSEEIELEQVVGARPTKEILLEGEKKQIEEENQREAGLEEVFEAADKKQDERYSQFVMEDNSNPSISKAPETLGVRKGAAIEEGWSPRRIDSRHKIVRKNPTLEQAKTIKRKKKSTGENLNEMR